MAALLLLLLLLLRLTLLLLLLLIRRRRRRSRCPPIILLLPPSLAASSLRRLVHHALQQPCGDPDTILRWGSLPGGRGRAGRGGSHGGSRGRETRSGKLSDTGICGHFLFFFLSRASFSLSLFGQGSEQALPGLSLSLSLCLFLQNHRCVPNEDGRLLHLLDERRSGRSRSLFEERQGEQKKLGLVDRLCFGFVVVENEDSSLPAFSSTSPARDARSALTPALQRGGESQEQPPR